MKKKFKIDNFKYFAPFSHKKINNKYLLVNEWGNFLYLSSQNFKKIQSGEVKKDNKTLSLLREKNFIRDDLDLSQLIERYRKKKSYLFGGPSLHIIIATLRCNFNCVYCHASARGAKEISYDMDLKTAEGALDIIFSTTNHYLAIEFQGGEPLLNLPVVKYIIKEAHKRNKKHKKDLEIRLVTNGSLITKELFNYLLKKKVSICLSLDGPEKLHNKQRANTANNNYKKVIALVKEFNKKYPELKKKGYIWKIATSLTITKASLPLWKEIIDEHINLGIGKIYLRNLNPFGFSAKSWHRIGYKMDEFLKFYRQSMDCIIRLNLAGKKIQERLSSVFLEKILTDSDPNHLEFRSPCGAGIGQLAYNYNGDIYTCDEGRMLSMMGDDSFKIGNVYKNSYKDIVTNPITKTLCTASCVEALPGCEQCIYKSFCSVCPIYNYSEYGNIFAQLPNNERCKLTMGVMDYLFAKMQDKKVKKIFRSWVEDK